MVKKQEKTIEQRLEETLVLYEKTPYNLPPNWCWVKLINLIKHQSGNSKLIKGKLPSEKSDGLYEAYSASGQDVFCSNYEHEGDAIIISAIGARCGKAFLANGKWSAVANTHIIYPTNGIDIKFLFYRMNNEKWWVRSGSAQPFVVVNETLERPFALPPIEEQKRIVDIIEKQFAKLDEARDLIQKSLDSFTERKSAILHRAFTGELTKSWREERHRIETKQEVCLGDVAEINPKSEKIVCNEDDDVSFVPMKAVCEIKGEIKEVLFEKYCKVKKGFTYFKENDVLFAKITPCMENGKCFIATGLKNKFGFASTEFYVFRCGQQIINRYLWYILRDKAFRNRAKQVMTGAVGQQRVPKAYLEKEKIALFDWEEQEEIVRILDSIFEKEDKSRELIDMLDKIDEMKQSILARAFRGELGTSNPADESAVDLLRSILENQVSVVEERKSNKRKTKTRFPFSPQLNRRQLKICELLIQNDGLTIDKIAQEIGKNVSYLFDDLGELTEKRMIKFIDNRYWINADNRFENK